MGNETSKLLARRLTDPRYAERWFVGSGIDIGAGPDSLGNQDAHFPRMHCRDWDTQHGDAMYLHSIPDEAFDFVYSSHCLEHTLDARVALVNWWRVLKPGGHLVVVVPDEDLYERGVWPPNKNATHYWSFTIWKRSSWSPKSLNVGDMVVQLDPPAQILKLESLDYPFDYTNPHDQSGGDAPVGIEMVLRKMTIAEIAMHGRF